jgi:peroxiredoxin
MNLANISRRSALFGFMAAATGSLTTYAQSTKRSRGPQPPEIGEPAKNFLLRDVLGRRVQLENLTHYGPVTLIFLRGYPKAQSATCRSQFQNFLRQAGQFGEKPSSVVFVYPGDRKDLEKHAIDFLGRFDMPQDFYMVLDSQYRLTKAYGLKWDALRETAYPCTLIVDRKGIVRFVKASAHHGGRTTPNDVLPHLDNARVAYVAPISRRR